MLNFLISFFFRFDRQTHCIFLFIEKAKNKWKPPKKTQQKTKKQKKQKTKKSRKTKSKNTKKKWIKKYKKNKKQTKASKIKTLLFYILYWGVILLSDSDSMQYDHSFLEHLLKEKKIRPFMLLIFLQQ